MDDISSEELARLTDYLLRELPADDIAAVEGWLSARVEHQAFLEYLHQPQMIRSMTSFEPEATVAQRVDAVSEALHARVRPEPVPRSLAMPGAKTMVRRQTEFSKSGRGAFLKRAPDVWRQATVGIGVSLLCLTAMWYGVRRDSFTRSPSENFVYMTAPGEQATVRLPDGSTVVLNVASRLEVPANYGRGHRKVRLDGEGLFTVVPQSRTPFTVTAGASTTRVLGTQFLVRYYATDTAATIAVKEGKVAVDSTVLTVDEQLTVSWTSRSKIQKADPAQFNFAAGVLTLRVVSLQDAIPALTRWYDVEIRLADATLALRRITGDFGAGSVGDLTAMLEAAFSDIGVIRDGRTITLYRR